ncbi:MAG: preprotein translocase subunit SecG [Bacteroidota bacterium]
MITLFLILVILASALLGAIVLIQNPKGGGLSGTIAGFSNQFMGVKQTTDVLEKGTWVLSSILALLCLVSVLFIQSAKDQSNDSIKNIPTTTSPAPVQNAPLSPAPVAPAPTK